VQLAREARARRDECVVAFGGDGTVNEIAGALTGSGTALGIIPCGSGNGLARHLGIPLNHTEAISLAARTPLPLQQMDLGLADGRAFVNVMGIGFDAELGRLFNQSQKRGFSAYLLIALRAWRSFEAPRVVVKTEDSRLLRPRCMVLAFANSTQYGNGALIAPWARTDDGLLEMISIAPANPFLLAIDALRLFRGTLRRSPRVSVVQGRSFDVECRAGTWFHLDGECHCSDKESIRVEAKKTALSVVAPGRL
jgi:YegS/Rv2252/BmrU family lipid kinase